MKNLNSLSSLLKKVNKVAEPDRTKILDRIVEIIEKSPKLGNSLPNSFKHQFLKMMDNSDPKYVLAAVKGLQYCLDQEVVEKLITKIGISEKIDSRIYQVISFSHLNVLSAILKVAQQGKIDFLTAIKFGLALVEDYGRTDEIVLQEQQMEQICYLLQSNYFMLDIETKLLILNIFSKLNLPNVHNFISISLQDGDSIVRDSALEAIRVVGVSSFIASLQRFSEVEDRDTKKIATEIVANLNMN